MKSADVVDRMLLSARVKKISELAKVLDVRANAVSNWKNRGVPEGELYKLSCITGVSVGWMKTGEGSMEGGGKQGKGGIDRCSLAVAIRIVEKVLERSGYALEADQKAEVVADLYLLQVERKKISEKTVQQLVERSVGSRPEISQDS